MCRSVTFVAFILCMSFLLVNAEYPRAVKTFYNPDCTICTDADNLVYSKASTSTDSLHYVLGGGKHWGPFTALIYYFDSVEPLLKVNWTALLSDKLDDRSNAFDFGYKPTSVFGLLLTKLYQFNDTGKDDNSAMLNKVNVTGQWPFDWFEWKNVEATSGGDVGKEYITFMTNSNLNNSYQRNLFQNNGSLSIRFRHDGQQGSNPLLPHLRYTGNNTQLELVLDKLFPLTTGARFAVELALVTNFPSLGVTLKVNTPRSLDDEETPGIFLLNNLLGQPNATSWNSSAYLQWKPIAYVTPDRHLVDSITIRNYDVQSLCPAADYADEEDALRRSLAYVYFGEALFDQAKTGVYLMNSSFGVHADPVYTNSSYIVWNLSYGMGVCPLSVVSVLVILLISCGLGLPFLIIIVGSVYMFVRRRLATSRSEGGLLSPGDSLPYLPINT